MNTFLRAHRYTFFRSLTQLSPARTPALGLLGSLDVIVTIVSIC